MGGLQRCGRGKTQSLGSLGLGRRSLGPKERRREDHTQENMMTHVVVDDDAVVVVVDD